MKISCQSCQAKYAIADEKVTGKVVKIRCKKCSNTIVIDGRPGAAAPLSAVPDAVWMVHLHAQTPDEGGETDEGQQVELPTHEVISAYRQGRINDATYCWKEGMADWLPLGEIEELVAAREQLPWPTADSGPDPASSEPPSWRYPANFGDAPTDTPALASPFADAPPAALFQNPSEMTGHARRPSRPSHPHFGSPEHAPPSSQPSGPPSGSMRFGVDGAAVDVAVGVPGGEGVDPRTGPPPSIRAPHPYPNTLLAPPSSDMLSRLSGPPSDPSPFALAYRGALDGNNDVKMTGERGESSVLFSLAAVKGEVPPAQSSEPTIGENSGMIDMRALMNAREQNPKHAPPPGGRVDDIMNLSPGGMLAGSLAPPVLSTATSTSGTTTAFAPGVAGGKSNSSLIAGTCVLVAGVIAAAAAGVYTLQQDQRAPAAPIATSSVTIPIPSASVTAGAPSATTGVPSAPTPAPLKFNVEAAKAELSKIAATLNTCKKAGGPTGSGKIMLTFSNDGKVEAATLDGKPFAKTPVGECVLARFSDAKVPTFGGGTQPTAKTFTIK